MEIGKLNVYYISSELSRVAYPAFFTDATESEFKELLDNYLSQNDSKGEGKINENLFAVYIAKNGYHVITTEPRKVVSPSIP
jgi:hypothetical protein